MVIVKLILCEFKRLALNNISYLEYTPKNKVQLILGTNGSGKSSILAELSPLPADKNFYNKDGYKLIVIEHRNSHYELKSSFASSGNRYHFIKDGEELNPGGTVTVYKELVKQHFNITQEVHDLMTGATVFHSMSVSERRRWLTLISDSDYTYAFKFYNKLKDQYRDIQGSIKISQSRLVQESDKLLSPEQESLCREEIANLRQFIAVLLDSKQPLIDRSAVRNVLNSLENTISSVANELLGHSKTMAKIDLNDITLIEKLLIETKSSILSYQDQSLRTFNRIQELNDQAHAIQHSAVESLADIDGQIDKLAMEVNKLQLQKQLNQQYDSPSTALQALVTIKEQLLQIVIGLPTNSYREFSRENHAKLLEKQSQLLNEITRKDQDQLKLISYKNELEHRRDHQQQSCPKCQHVWSHGYDIETYNKLLISIENGSTTLDELNKQRVSLETSLEAHRSYSELMRDFRALSYHWTILDPLWAYIASESIIYDNPKLIIQIVNDLSADLTLDVQIQAMNSQIEDLVKVKLLLSDNQELDCNKLQQSIEDANKELFNIGEVIQAAKAKVVEYEQYRITLIAIHRLSEELGVLISTRSTKADELLLSIKQEALNQTIQLLQLELNQKEQLLSKVDVQKAVIDNIQATITEMTERQEVLKIAIKELSPTEGLIAVGLTSFINNFVKQINSFISKIWLYPLELIPIMPDENDGVDLDYKFSVRINDSFNIPDIGKGSSAMRQVIDLAFVIVSMQYLNLADAPIYLDEFAAAFDKEHRKSAFYVITNLMTSSAFSQIFLISHYEDMFGSITNSDMNILSASNITIPKESVFNQNLIMR